ncbi:hypothetical protein DFP73DRAFT_525609 [Morchella snyderi]|nr:hypothetical protein DFP73DRAFT_525609 [Morchella snyderi]
MPSLCILMIAILVGTSAHGVLLKHLIQMVLALVKVTVNKSDANPSEAKKAKRGGLGSILLDAKEYHAPTTAVGAFKMNRTCRTVNPSPLRREIMRREITVPSRPPSSSVIPGRFSDSPFLITTERDVAVEHDDAPAYSATRSSRTGGRGALLVPPPQRANLWSVKLPNAVAPSRCVVSMITGPKKALLHSQPRPAFSEFGRKGNRAHNMTFQRGWITKRVGDRVMQPTYGKERICEIGKRFDYLPMEIDTPQIDLPHS